MAAWEGSHSCSRVVAAVPPTCPWTQQCVCTVCSELFGLHRLNSPELLADCWLVFQVLSLILSHSLSQSPERM